MEKLSPSNVTYPKSRWYNSKYLACCGCDYCLWHCSEKHVSPCSLENYCCFTSCFVVILWCKSKRTFQKSVKFDEVPSTLFPFIQKIYSQNLSSILDYSPQLDFCITFYFFRWGCQNYIQYFGVLVQKLLYDNTFSNEFVSHIWV